MPKLAIITACYNAPDDLIHRHFTSVEEQDEDYIHIVVDDCSSELKTRAALLYHADRLKDNTVLIAKQDNSGPGAARNRAIKYLEHHYNNIEYICLLDADDYFEPDSLEVRRCLLDDNKNFIAVYGDKYTARYEPRTDQLDGKTFLAEVSKTLESVSNFDKARLFRECYIPSCSVMFKWKPFLKYIKEFREDVRLCEDWLIWRKLSLLGDFKKVSMPIYTQTLHGRNLTTNPSILKNHLKDMITTKVDLEQWMSDNAGVIQL